MVAPSSPRELHRQPARLPREQRREHFLDVAAELIAETGLDSVTMEAVAARAGVSKGLGYAYFENSADLLVALFDREMAALDRQVVAALAEAGTFEGKLRATLVTWFALVAERGPLLAALFVPKVDGALASRRHARNREVERFWADMAVREYGLDQSLAEAAASILLAGTNGALAQWGERRASRTELIDLFVTMTTGALDALRTAAQRG